MCVLAMKTFLVAVDPGFVSYENEIAGWKRSERGGYMVFQLNAPSYEMLLR